MKKVLLFILSFQIGEIASAQPTYEIREYKGKVHSIEPGFRFAYEEIHLQIDDKREKFLFYPDYGDFILSHLKVGDEVALRVNVNVKMRASFEKLRSEQKNEASYFQRDYVVAINLNGEWRELPETILPENQVREYEHNALLDRKVLQVYSLNNYNRALVFDKGLIAYTSWIMKSYNPLKDIRNNDIVSFSGFKLSNKSGYRYPVENVKNVYHYTPLTKQKGELISYLYKQNYVCIGAKFLTQNGEVTVSFPSDRAKAVFTFLKPEREVYFYFHDFVVENQLNAPELHAIVQGLDTLYIGRYGFYGGADVEHEHKAAIIHGKIKEVNRSDKGRILSLIIHNDCYIEIDPRFEKQIGQFLKRGITIEVRGEERIKKEGEIYSKNYRIITPQQISLDGKVYLLNQLP